MGEFRRDGPADLWWNLGPAGRVGLLILIAILLSALSAVVLLRSGSDGDAPPVIVREVTPTPPATPPPTPTATPALTATPATTGTATATPTPTESPDPPADAITPTPASEDPVGSIDELHSGFGEPPSAVLGRLRVPALGIDAPLGARSVGGDGQMPNPVGPSDVIWYDFSEWEGVGGTIGGGGNAVFSGHVDYAAHVAYAGVDFRGRGVFFSLSLLSPGDVIEVESGGQTVRYAVSWRQLVNAVDSDWGEILSSDVPVDSITLITCGGEFNFESRSYVDRVVVRAERI